MEPLAYKIRPTSFDEVIGHDPLIKIIQEMLQNDHLVSMILYGPTGVGKTTLALLIAEHFPLNHFKFNASTDPKASLRQIIDSGKHYGSILLIVDEIHRMNKDIQDYLLPYVESGQVILLGLTTENPYVSVNPAVRSRVLIYRMDRPSREDIVTYLKKVDVGSLGKNIHLTDEIYEYIALSSNGELRTALNMLEIIYIVSKDGSSISIDDAVKIVSKPNLSVDKNGNDYYDILSAYHKSVRGSDVNGALHYLARLIVADDLESILRRMSAIVYEDIGLANPTMGTKVSACVWICRYIGFPEAVNALGALTIEMCLSPKSNSAHLAVNAALDDVRQGKTYKVPSHLINNPTYDEKKAYLYAHDYPNHIVAQDFLPKELKGKIYYHPQDHTKLEKLFEEQYNMIEKILKSKKAED
ncbi:MAG: replication-associated recombination protein A [Candidatus Izemoplasmatales bacterium]